MKKSAILDVSLSKQIIETQEEIQKKEKLVLDKLFEHLYSNLLNQYKQFLKLPTYENNGRNLGESIAYLIFTDYRSKQFKEGKTEYLAGEFFSIPEHKITELRHAFTIEKIKATFKEIGECLRLDIYVKEPEGDMIRIDIKILWD